MFNKKQKQKDLIIKTFNKVQRMLPNSKYTIENLKQIIKSGDLYSFLNNVIIDLLKYFDDANCLIMYKKYFKEYDFYLNHIKIFKFEGIKITFDYFDEDNASVIFCGIKIPYIIDNNPIILNYISSCLSKKRNLLENEKQLLVKNSIYDKFKNIFNM